MAGDNTKQVEKPCFCCSPHVECIPATCLT